MTRRASVVQRKQRIPSWRAHRVVRGARPFHPLPLGGLLPLRQCPLGLSMISERRRVENLLALVLLARMHPRSGNGRPYVLWRSRGTLPAHLACGSPAAQYLCRCRTAAPNREVSPQSPFGSHFSKWWVQARRRAPRSVRPARPGSFGNQVWHGTTLIVGCYVV